MTATTARPTAYDLDDPRLRRLFAGPAEGWTTLVAVALMIVALGWSIDDPRWILNVDRMTDFLPLVGLAGVAVGFIGPKLGWGRWTTHLIGVAFAAMILPIIAGGMVLGETVEGWGPVALATRYREAADIVTRVWIDLGVLGLPRTNEFGHYFIAIGGLVWATGQFASYAVFGHRRALDAVIVTGLVLLANMSLTRNDQLHLMILFSIAALALLTRAHAFDEQVTWLRRRIGDPATVTQLYLQGGAVFISVAVLGSLFLTATASSKPLQGLWQDVPGRLAELSQWLQKYLPLTGASRNPGVVVFGEDAPIIGSWTSSNDVAFRVQLPATETEDFYWLVGTYHEFQFTSWSWGDTDRVSRDAREDLLAGLPDDPLAQGLRREVRFEVTPQGFATKLVVSPQTVRWIDRPSRVRTTVPRDYFAAVEYDDSGPYTVTALVPVWGSDPGALSENRLRVASRDYAAEIQRLYLSVPTDAIGPEAEALLAAIVAAAPSDNPYDLARTMESYLKSGRNFNYDTDVTDLAQARCRGLSTVECFAVIRAGYCLYYASTMAILLRELGIPTRLAQGFLPGDRDADGTEVVRISGAHAWVQVYFPGYGWVDFDPTGGDVSQIGVRPSGAPETPTPRPSFVPGTVGPRESDDGVPGSRDPSAPAGPTTNQPPTAGPYIAIGGLLLIGILALAYVAWKRGPRPMHPDRAWGSIGRWAARFGLGPRASQTVFEYAGVLGDAVPVVRPELRTVANAKVEIAYARRTLGDDRMRAVAAAHRRLRLGLLRLAFRRPKGRRRPR